jgi:hypothetical protein
MSDKVTIELPDELARSARAMAAAGRRRLEEAVVEWVRWAVAEPELKTLPDAELLRLCDSTFEPDDQRELSDLLRGRWVRGEIACANEAAYAKTCSRVTSANDPTAGCSRASHAMKQRTL